MRSLYLIVICLASASLLFGQLESDTLTFQSSRDIYLQPDEVIFSLSLTSSADTTFDQIVASLQGSGVSPADFTGVMTWRIDPSASAPNGLLWSFTSGVPFAMLKATVASLNAIQTSLAKTSGVVLTFQPQGSRVSPELRRAQTCSLRDLVADAQVQAKGLAAAGYLLGPILAISDTDSVGLPGVVEFAVGASPAGSGTGISPTGFQLSTVVSTSPTLRCLAEVKFKLIRLH